MLHYAPQHVSSSTLLIIRRTNCITTASGIVTLCKQLYSMQVESDGILKSIYNIFVNYSWVDTRWQQYSTNLHTNNIQNNTMKQNTQNGTYITIRMHKHKNKDT